MSGLSKNSRDVTAALRQGKGVVVEKKWNAGTNKNRPVTINAARLEQDDLQTALPKLTNSFRDALQKARMEKKMTQSQLAQAINEKPSVVADYESGRAIPNGQIITKLQKVLGCHLPKAVQKPPKPQID
ncbi:putative multiprotein bridging factor type 1 [Gregarina niphandrodes]|uniref:Multiprotein bridging factor type 1 n=1 Tax=Gregarina niphandrodes TaxID=110365 RepID=A0A023B682_GRENI|nr:putative multiprotein bridging factor type 1 [Gregarina niphandrodes]EZG65880.1 putative multiprotein bridging factor type 1 [Gregarina niphandrodes]|eukprot:XP_011134038.1 putative multiprotein bridging factor type 1 [Gregarina niphandrodes]